MKSLDPAFDAEGTITAATSSPISVGASAMILASGDYVQKNNIEVKFKIKSRAIAGVDWKTMGAGPLPAYRKST